MSSLIALSQNRLQAAWSGPSKIRLSDLPSQPAMRQTDALPRSFGHVNVGSSRPRDWRGPKIVSEVFILPTQNNEEPA